MDVVSACPLRVGSLVWQARPQVWVVTVVCKGTFRLAPEVCPLAPEQEDPSEDDNHWDDDPLKSVYAPGDLVPFKTRADVLLVGYAFAPKAAGGPSFQARLVVGEVDKAVAVHGDRVWTLDGRLREIAPLTRVPLRYERAAGGPDTANPVGMRADAANALGEIPIPNLWPPGRSPRQRGEIVEPIAFGPIAAMWPWRRDKLGPLARGFSVRLLAKGALPTDVEPGFFSAAPRDQQTSEIRADERVVLENLHPVHPRLVTSLPGIAPRAFVERRQAPRLELALRADTLWIDTNRQLLTVTWRAQVPLAAADEPGHVIVGLDSTGAGAQRMDPPRATAAGQPRGPSAADEADAESLSDDDVRDAGDSMVVRAIAPLPGVGRGPYSTHQNSPPAASQEDAASTLFLMGAPDVAQTLPFAQTDPGGADPMRRAEQQAAASRGPGALPPGWSPAQAPPTMVLGASEVSPPLQRPMEPPPMVRVPLQEEIAPRPEPVREVAVAGALAKATEAGRDVARVGVLGFSDAAAGAHRAVVRDQSAGELVSDRAEPRPAEVRSRPAEVLKLLWFDPKIVVRLQRHPEWRVILAEMELRMLDERADEEDGSEEGQSDGKARRSVFEVLSCGLPSPPDSLRRALAEAVDGRGMFEPPLVLLTGELEFPFDEVETLKAAVTVLTPLGALPENKALKEALEAAQDLLKIPGVEQFGRMAESQTQRLREAFAQTRKALPADYVDANLERALLRQRAYSWKTLYGKRWIRALLRGTGGSGAGAGGRGDGSSRGDGASRGEAAPPVYLPEELKDALPAYKRVRVKALGEVDLQEDQEEAANWVVKVAAIARVVQGF